MTTQPLHLLLVDDEAPARARLKDLLSDIAAEMPTVVVGEAADGIAALEFLASPGQRRVDLILLDIRMPRLDGIGLVQHLAGRENAPPVIFVTAYDQYAVLAFDLNAIDYLLKPVRAPRLLAALRKLPTSLPSQAALRSLSPQGRSHLHSTERGRILLVPLDEILFLRAELKYVTARTKAREFLIEESLTHLEEEFANRFVRTHRNCLVARNAIVGVARDPSGQGENHWWALLRDLEEKLPVSRRQWPMVKALLKEEGI